MPQTPLPSVSAHSAPPALTSDDYQQLFQMALSPDEKTRAQVGDLVGKMTSAEKQTFADFQKTAHGSGPADLHRHDNQIGGMPPEMAVAMGIPIARATASGVVAGVRALGSAAGSIGAAEAKYHATKFVLRHLGIPNLLAESAAVAVSAYSPGGKGGAVPAAEAEAATVRPSLDPVIKTSGRARPGLDETIASPSRSAPVEPVAASAPSISAADLTTEEAKALKGLVKEGHSESDVLSMISEHRAASAPVTKPPTRAEMRETPGKVTLSAAESQEFMRLLKRGLPEKEAMDLVQQQRAAVSKWGLPSAEEARLAVKDRNASGRWKD